MDAGDPVRGIEMNGCSGIQRRNRMLGKDKRNLLDLILFRPVTLSVTPTLGRIGIDLTRFYSQLCGVNTTLTLTSFNVFNFITLLIHVF